MAPSGQDYLTDWTWSNNSNVHVAVHKDWFTPGTFVEFESVLTNNLRMPLDDQKVQGMGDVELDIRTSATDPKRSNKIVLENVLYAPGYPTNILGNPIEEEFFFVRDNRREKLSRLIEKETGEVAGLLDHPFLCKVWLVGLARGQTVLEEGGVYVINAYWTDEERRRVGRMLKGRERVPKYNVEEKAWLKEHWGGEWHFLVAHGLKMHDEENREDGRRLVRSLMRGD